MGFSWQSPPPDEVFEAGLRQYERDLKAALLQLALSFAPKIEADMRASAPWTDRTGNLRASLYAAVENLVHEIAIYIDYGLDYGVYLEFKNASRYAVIAPTLDKWGPLVWEAVRRLIS